MAGGAWTGFLTGVAPVEDSTFTLGNSDALPVVVAVVGGVGVDDCSAEDDFGATVPGSSLISTETALSTTLAGCGEDVVALLLVVVAAAAVAGVLVAVVDDVDTEEVVKRDEMLVAVVVEAGAEPVAAVVTVAVVVDAAGITGTFTTLDDGDGWVVEDRTGLGLAYGCGLTYGG